ncbi:MAG: efflux RND transporter periplasmic adaptor subunit [Pseudohongiella sp.]|nr:efflux RND transporter periplasmic adaptor subunit [Pseudohongiella sp.]
MHFLTRHPLLIVFIAGALALSYGLYTKLQEAPAGGPPGMMGGPPGGMGQTTVTVAVVSREMLADDVESVGTAQANESLNLTAKVSDTVTAIHFNDGGFVEQGDVLVELTNNAEAARLSEARASEADARRQYDRLQSLIETNLISQTDLDDARTRWETAEARLEGVIANMDDRLIRAPFTGILGFRNISEGSLVTPNTVITTLDDISTIKLDFNIAEVYLAQLQPGQTITANSIVYRGQEFQGIVTSVGSRVDTSTRSVQVRAEIDNTEGLLRPGMLLTVGLTLNPRDAVVVPEAAVVPSQGRQYVFVVDEESVARRVEVQLGRRRPGQVEIVSGVVPGQRVVTQGIAQVRPGSRVRILNQEGAVPTSAASPANGLKDRS